MAGGALGGLRLTLALAGMLSLWVSAVSFIRSQPSSLAPAVFVVASPRPFPGPPVALSPSQPTCICSHPSKQDFLALVERNTGHCCDFAVAAFTLM